MKVSLAYITYVTYITSDAHGCANGAERRDAHERPSLISSAYPPTATTTIRSSASCRCRFQRARLLSLLRAIVLRATSSLALCTSRSSRSSSSTWEESASSQGPRSSRQASRLTAVRDALRYRTYGTI